MKPKEKAKELVHKFYRYVPADEEHEHEYAKQCALIAVDEILEELPEGSIDYGISSQRRYWEEVKEEINKL
jgi:hypothetical protein